MLQSMMLQYSSINQNQYFILNDVLKENNSLFLSGLVQFARSLQSSESSYNTKQTNSKNIIFNICLDKI